MAYNYADLLAGESLEQVVGKTLGGHAYDIFVHAVGAGAHDAAQTAGAEFERAVEGVDKGSLVLGVEHGLNGFLGLGIVDGGVEPLLCFSGALGNEFLIFHSVDIVFFLMNFLNVGR